LPIPQILQTLAERGRSLLDILECVMSVGVEGAIDDCMGQRMDVLPSRLIGSPWSSEKPRSLRSNMNAHRSTSGMTTSGNGEPTGMVATFAVAGSQVWVS
jgi:hypothetical protein